MHYLCDVGRVNGHLLSPQSFLHFLKLSQTVRILVGNIFRQCNAPNESGHIQALP